MPLLSEAHVQELLKLVSLHRNCGECGHSTAQDYCRTCDEFYWIHAPGCRMYLTRHFGHRLTIRTEPIANTRAGHNATLECGHGVQIFGRLELAGGVALCTKCRDLEEGE